ncbi:helix-turn-helix domain-containing protein [Pedobacter punctiformis]|uniref:Helix-turn-helix domain-containing protein n=1 Tax=Pedobacter punctiformis TaxID=3004097 RepID=A0ABT4LDW1_9SPHI|nr:helix-turn-helix domain-containing protein [Pedobacter sp. HCMS5-2]MCZ4245912.1 helix-turn-helix domain-containing protein [Pedobacter sp. HCMS5-2]
MARENDYSFEEILKVIEAHRMGKKSKDICAELHIDPTTFYRWQRRYGKFVDKFAELKNENEKLKFVYESLFERHEEMLEALDIFLKKIKN